MNQTGCKNTRRGRAWLLRLVLHLFDLNERFLGCNNAGERVLEKRDGTGCPMPRPLTNLAPPNPTSVENIASRGDKPIESRLEIFKLCVRNTQISVILRVSQSIADGHALLQLAPAVFRKKGRLNSRLLRKRAKNECRVGNKRSSAGPSLECPILLDRVFSLSEKFDSCSVVTGFSTDATSLNCLLGESAIQRFDNRESSSEKGSPPKLTIFGMNMLQAPIPIGSQSLEPIFVFGHIFKQNVLEHAPSPAGASIETRKL